MRLSLRTTILVSITIVLLVLALPATIRAFFHKGIYRFSREFLQTWWSVSGVQGVCDLSYNLRLAPSWACVTVSKTKTGVALHFFGSLGTFEARRSAERVNAQRSDFGDRPGRYCDHIGHCLAIPHLQAGKCVGRTSGGTRTDYRALHILADDNGSDFRPAWSRRSTQLALCRVRVRDAGYKNVVLFGSRIGSFAPRQ